MTPRPFVRRSRHEDIEWMHPRLSRADVEEIAVIGDETPLEALTTGFEQSTECLTAVGTDGKPFAMFGVGPSRYSKDIGIVWMLATDSLLDVSNKRTFLKQCRRWLDYLQRHFLVVQNVAHIRNSAHLKWLKWTGCRVLQSVTINGEEFLHFERTVI